MALPLLPALTLREWTGPLTRDLVQKPGEFGLGMIPDHKRPDAVVNSVCGYCSTGCNLRIHLREGQAVNLSPSADYPVNLGMACPKGWEALTPLRAPDRATTPLLRDASGTLQPIDWTTAATHFAERLKSIQASHGPDSLAFISTGQIPTEEMAFLGALAKFGMGFKHGDGNTRQCMATAVVAYKESFGFDAPPYTYQDFEESDCLVFIGSNLAIAHPILWQRVLRNRHQPDIIVIDPRCTETAMAATQHLAIAPKSDLAFLYGTAQALIAAGAVDLDFISQHTSGYEAFAEFVAGYTPEKTCEAAGLERAGFDHFIASLVRGKRVSFWWTMGVNQSHEAVRTAQAIINLALMTGNIGRPGTGANSITGQCNAMGSRLFSNTTNLLGGHDFTKAEHRQKVANALGLDVSRIPETNSLAYDQIIDGIESGRIKGLWIIATNTAHSWINSGRFAKIREKLEFLVVQDMYHSTETAQMADLVLPAAGWGEKDGTFINSERRFGLLRKVSKAPGQALADFHIFRLLAEAWGVAPLFKAWSSPEAVFRLMQRLSAGQPCDITGIAGYAMLEARGGVQWPCPAGLTEPGPQRRLFGDGQFFTADGRAKFIFESPRPMAEPIDEAYPMILLTGRGTTSQWHTQTRTSKSGVLRRLYPEDVYVEIHPDDAAQLGIEAHSSVTISSRRISIRATAVITPIVQPGQVFMPMHYAETNLLTRQEVDPWSRQPSYKYTAVKLSQ